MPSLTDKQLEAILDRIRLHRNVDFRNYKRATLRRRIERRLFERRCSDVADYVALLEREPQEFDSLISSMFIKVTRFFRDDDIWHYIADRVLPDIIAGKRGKQSLRIWCAGCATGEEVFSVAILIADALGPSLGSWDVKIFGTDVDERSVAFARRATYSPLQLEGLPKTVLERWFDPAPEGYAVRKEIRRLVVFGANNLVSDAPISQLDLILCRNVFIYLDAEMQKRVIMRFHYALRRDGVLVLGKSELIPFAAKLFRPLDLSRRTYVKDDRKDLDARPLSLTSIRAREQPLPSPLELSLAEEPAGWRYHREILDALQAPAVATSLDGEIKFWGAGAARVWGHQENEVIGKKLASLNLPGISGDLLIEKTSLVSAGRKERETTDGLIPVAGSIEPMMVRISVSTLRNAATQIVGLLYVVDDVTALRTLERGMQRVNEELQISNHKLKSTNEELQATNEELETTNEELQSANEELQTTNEELQTTNEELQSANEELETTNEELQSTNVELDATNRELAHRTEEMNLLGFYHRTIIRSLSAAIVVLDSTGVITLWNIASERLLGLAEIEAVGQVFWTLRVPALRRSVVSRIRKLLREDRAFREDNMEYDLPTGGYGYANVAALPLIESKSNMGAAIIFEDVTRFVRSAERHLRSKREAAQLGAKSVVMKVLDSSEPSGRGGSKQARGDGKKMEVLPVPASAKAGSGRRHATAAKKSTAVKARSLKDAGALEHGPDGASRRMNDKAVQVEFGGPEQVGGET